MTSRETLPLRFDTSAYLEPGETPSAPATTLYRLDTGATYAGGLSGAPSLSGNYITQTITALTKGITYRLSVRFTAATGKIWDILLDIPCRD